MVASLQKQTDSMDVRAIEVTIKDGDTVVDMADGVVKALDGTAKTFVAVDLPASALVLSAGVRGIVAGMTVGVGTDSTGVDVAAAAPAVAGVEIDITAEVQALYNGLKTPLTVNAEVASAGGEAVLLVTYILRGSSEYNI